MKKIIVTTAHKTNQEHIELAQAVAASMDCMYVSRGKNSLKKLRDNYDVDSVIVAKEGHLLADTEAGEFYFHPSMAHLRLKNYHLGYQDHMLEAMNIQQGDSVLDCTLGLGADAIVASHVVGDLGQVTGLEASPVIACIVKYGMSHDTAENYDIHSAMRRIKVINIDYFDFLRAQPDKSFDVVYFDPMFRHPLCESNAIAPLRCFADGRAVSKETVREACRVARSRVVFKENARSLEFERLGFQETVGGKYSPVKYGVMKIC